MASLDSAEPASLHVLEIVGNAVIGGMERQVQALAESLLAQGNTVSALGPFESAFTSALRGRGCQVHIAMLEEAMEWRSLLTATELIRRQQIDVIHAHLFNATYLGNIAGSLTGVPVAATVHGMYINPEEVALARLTGNHLITVCTAAYMMGLSLGVPEEQISLIPNGVDTQRFRPDVDGRPFRQRLGLPDDTRLVGMVSRLVREKGADQFLRVATRVTSAHRDVHFVLAGDGPLYSELAREVEAMGLTDRFHLPGMIADTSTVYPALDVVCLSSKIEGQPLTLLEAMSAERPVVANSVGGVPELVQMAETGWLVAQGDVGAMSERTLWLLDNPERAREMGQAGRRRVTEFFDINIQAAAIVRLFHRLMESRRSQARTPFRLGKLYNNHARI